MILSAAGLLSTAAAVESQNLFSPGFHFGELNVPDLEEKLEFGLHLDRFTEFGKPEWPACDNSTVFAGNAKKYGLTMNDGTTDPVRIDETIGLNLLALSFGRQINRFWQPSVRVYGALGNSADGPTATLQNQVMHQFLFDLLGDPACDVPRKRNEADWRRGLAPKRTGGASPSGDSPCSSSVWDPPPPQSTMSRSFKPVSDRTATALASL